MTDGVDAIDRVTGIRRVRGVRKLTWFGEPLVELEGSEPHVHLASLLYSSAYTQGRPQPFEPVADRPDPIWRDLPVEDRLDARWPGWTQTEWGQLERPGQPRLAEDGPPGPVAPSVAAVSDDAMPGWILFRQGDVTSAAGSVRVYANTDAKTVHDLVPDLVAVLLDAGLESFSMKFLATTAHAERTDSTVLYLPERVDLLREIAAVLESALIGEATPMFTYRLGPGVALARSPVDGDSFGVVRCRQIAAAIVEGRRSGGSIEVPFDRSSPWDLAGHRPLRRHVAASLRLPRRSLDNPETALLNLAGHLVREAVKVGNRSTWLHHDDLRHQWLTTGPDVYSGSAGGLLVLVHADRFSGGAQMLRLARSVARDILARQPEIAAKHGFHSGPAGTAAVLAEAAVIAGDDELADIAAQSLAAASAAAPSGGAWDILAGAAGTIVGLHAAATLNGSPVPSVVDDLAQQLVGCAEDLPDQGLARWRAREGRRRPTLAGLAHGGSGAALALGLVDHPEAPGLLARSVAFEDEHRADSRGWIDCRTPLHGPVATAWCHGAAGIGLASAALALRGAAPLRYRVVLAADRVADALRSDEQQGGLCHGRSGRALALAVMGRFLGDEAAENDAVAAVSRLPPITRPFDPGLMIGESGIVLAALALRGEIAAPLGFVLDPALCRLERSREPVTPPQ